MKSLLIQYALFESVPNSQLPFSLQFLCIKIIVLTAQYLYELQIAKTTQENNRMGD